MDWLEIIKHFGTVGGIVILASYFIGKAIVTVFGVGYKFAR